MTPKWFLPSKMKRKQKKETITKRNEYKYTWGNKKYV